MKRGIRRSEVFYVSWRQGDFTTLLGLCTTQREYSRTGEHSANGRAPRRARRVLHYVSDLSHPFEISGTRASRQTGPFDVLE